MKTSTFQLLRQLPLRTGNSDADTLGERETAVAAALPLPLGVHAARDQVETGRLVFTYARLIDHHQAIRIIERQRFEQHAAHDRER